MALAGDSCLVLSLELNEGEPETPSGLWVEGHFGVDDSAALGEGGCQIRLARGLGQVGEAHLGRAPQRLAFFVLEIHPPEMHDFPWISEIGKLASPGVVLL